MAKLDESAHNRTTKYKQSPFVLLVNIYIYADSTEEVKEADSAVSDLEFIFRAVCSCRSWEANFCMEIAARLSYLSQKTANGVKFLHHY